MALTAALVSAGPAIAQSVQYTSPAGEVYRSQVDTGPVARAERALASAPAARRVEMLLNLGLAQSGARQFREAIATFSRALILEPDNALVLRWRGHRFLSVREFDKAMANLSRGARLDSTIYGNWYHLGVVKFALGDFHGAATAFERALPLAPDAGELAGSTDWRWMSLARAGRSDEARTFLNRRTDSLATTVAYAQRLRLYRGEITANQVFTPADTVDVQVATLAFGLGNWFLVQGDSARARDWFERSVASGGWPGFGFIVSEAELKRMR